MAGGARVCYGFGVGAWHLSLLGAVFLHKSLGQLVYGSSWRDPKLAKVADGPETFIYGERPSAEKTETEPERAEGKGRP